MTNLDTNTTLFFQLQQNRYTQIGRGKREGLFSRLACRQTMGHGLDSLNGADPYGGHTYFHEIA